MKRFTREEMQNITATLHKANRLMESLANMSQEQAVTTLTKCQESAISLGEALERYGEVGEQIIHLLEEYCEALFQQSQCLGNAEYQKEFRAGIEALLGMIENKIKNDLPEDKKVVVFLPYKASMWDSLESVWKAADEDPACDAYVVPIPYFDKNEDNSFGEMHYEGDQYPDYVPVWSWEEFSIPDMKPDTIFIHNPYDNYNFVTSVHPMFYSSELKKHTKELVYIPYFVLAEPDITKEMTPEEEEKLYVFCMQPGVIEAHKVIVQSEAMRQRYIEVLTKNIPITTREYWEERILGLGSPKFDKVSRTEEAELEIPEEWKPVLYKPDGTRKKVILYNTSVTALLDNDEKMLKKMQDVFRVFYENKEEVALLWRPHPLMKITIQRGRPELWEQYEAIVEEYKQATWGIYDDTADLNRAIALADAYYGDPSSLVQLCQEKGMPCMVQNVDVLCEDCYSLAMENVLDCADCWLFFAYQQNALFKIEKKTFVAEKILQIPRNNQISYPQYGRIYKYKNKIVLLPWHENSIIVYELDTRKQRAIFLFKNEHKEGMKFLDVIIENNKMLLIPCAYNQILMLDMEEEKLSVVFDIVETNNKMLYAWGAMAIYNDKVLFTELTGNKIWVVELVKGVASTYQCNLLEFGGSGVCVTDNFIWIIPLKTDKILRWDKKSKKCCVIKEFPKDYICGEKSFYKIVVNKNNIYMLPRESNMLLVINELGEISKIDTETENEIKPENAFDKYMRYSCIWSDGELLYLMTSRKGILYRINDEKRVEKIKIRIEKKEWLSCRNEKIVENIYESLMAFLNDVIIRTQG